VLLLAQLGCSRSSPNPAEKLFKSLRGDWKVTSLVRNGESSGPDALTDMSVKVDGDKIKFDESYGPAAAENGVSTRGLQSDLFVMQINPTKAGEIDFVYTAGVNEGKTRLGLYELQGNTLKICLASAGNTRPSQIAAGDDVTLYILERQK
jgi:uncharacterized protein (TIGR03067 family)